MTPTHPYLQVGDIDRTSDTYSWLDGTQPPVDGSGRYRPGTWNSLSDMAITAFAQLAHGRETAPIAPAPPQEWWLSFGLRFRPLLRGGLVTRD